MDDLLEALEALDGSDGEQVGWDDVDDDEETAGGAAVPGGALSDLTAERFRTEFLQPGRPVVIEDHEGRAVPLHLTVDYFLRNHGGRSIPVDFGGPGEQLVTLSAFLEFRDPVLRHLYLRNLQMGRWFPEEAKALQLPPEFGDNLLADPLRVPHVPPVWRNWFELFICTRECPGFPFLHQDMCHIHAFSLQIQGSKHFTLFEPSDSSFLYPAGGTNSRSRIPDIRNVNLSEFPLFAKANPIEVQLNAGEMLFMPSDWWHTTHCEGIEPSVTLASSIVDESVYEPFMDAYCEFRAMQSLVKRGAGVMMH